MKKIFTIFVFAILVASAVFVSAGGFDKFKKDVNDHATVFIPEHAVDLGNGVFDLGLAVDVNGDLVQGYMHVYKKGNAKPLGSPGGKKEKGGSTCYQYFAKGAIWKATENYVFGKDVDKAKMEASMEEWENEVTGFEIFGNLDTVNVTNGDDEISPDGLNEVMHRNLGSTNTIAYTITWGVFGGRPNTRVLSEWDMVFNDNYAFGDGSVNSSLMDYQNIATHELGHALGLGHPDITCTEETMFASARFGETKKRTLNAGDREGIVKLY